MYNESIRGSVTEIIENYFKLGRSKKQIKLLARHLKYEGTSSNQKQLGKAILIQLKTLNKVEK